MATKKAKKTTTQHKQPQAPKRRRARKNPRKQSPVTQQPTQTKPSGGALRFTPTAWAKLVWLRDRGDTEIGGFGIAHAEDPLLIEDFVTVRQQTTCASVEFDDQAVADFFDTQFDEGRKPEQFARVWLHTHPGDNPHPSLVDEETFERVFGPCDWAVMAILASGGDTYARLRFNVGPGGEQQIPIAIAWNEPFAAADPESWDAEYLAHVQPVGLNSNSNGNDETDLPFGSDWFDDPTWLEPYSIDPTVLDQLDTPTLSASVMGDWHGDTVDEPPDIEAVDFEF